MKEHQHVEWKEAWRDEYLKWISGFANASGGVLVIGRNDKGEVVGARDAGKLLVDLPNKVRDVLGIVVAVNLKRARGKETIEIVVDPYPYAVAETIENNVRRTILKEHLADPAYYQKMSALLDEIILLRKIKSIEYEDYLKRIAELARNVETGVADETPEPLKKSAGLRALYNNLGMPHRIPGRVGHVAETPDESSGYTNRRLALAVRIDETVRRVRPDAWRGIQARENTIKAALLPLLQHDVAEVERVFLIIKAQGEY